MFEKEVSFSHSFPHLGRSIFTDSDSPRSHKTLKCVYENVRTHRTRTDQNISLGTLQLRPEYLRCLSVVEPEVVAGLQVEGDGGVRYAVQVHCQHLLGHIVVVQLVVAQSDVNLQCEEISEREHEMWV